MKNPSNLLEDVRKCLTDPVSDILQNFSLEKSRFYYDKWATQRAAWDYKFNPADKQEEVSFDFCSLDELTTKSIEAHNVFVNIKKEDFFKWADWYIFGQNVVVEWHRLKSFDEWLHDWLYEALCQAYQTPEDGARKILEKKLWKWVYTNTAIHCFAEWIITEDVLKRLWQYEKYQAIEGRNMEDDIEEAKKALEDMKENNKSTTVLTFKLK